MILDRAILGSAFTDEDPKPLGAPPRPASPMAILRLELWPARLSRSYDVGTFESYGGFFVASRPRWLKGVGVKGMVDPLWFMRGTDTAGVISSPGYHAPPPSHISLL